MAPSRSRSPYDRRSTCGRGGSPTPHRPTRRPYFRASSSLVVKGGRRKTSSRDDRTRSRVCDASRYIRHQLLPNLIAASPAPQTMTGTGCASPVPVHRASGSGPMRGRTLVLRPHAEGERPTHPARPVPSAGQIPAVPGAKRSSPTTLVARPEEGRQVREGPGARTGTLDRSAPGSHDEAGGCRPPRGRTMRTSQRV